MLPRRFLPPLLSFLLPGFLLLAAVTLLHAGAALQHHLVLRDATLARMLPRGWLRTPDRDI